MIRLSDRAKSDIRFAMQIDANVGRNEAESKISFSLHNKSNVKRGSIQEMFYYAETM